jgi:hypothetical protein
MGKVRVSEYEEGRNRWVTVVPLYRVRQSPRVKNMVLFLREILSIWRQNSRQEWSKRQCHVP